MTSLHEIPGFSLELKRWGIFLVDQIKEVPYNEKAFQNLVLSEKKKKLISSLVGQEDLEWGNEFDDLIKGKGKGFIFLLSGPPGVGKTYTAG